MIYFILLSVHLGMLAIITGTSLAARDNLSRGRWISGIIGAMHCSVWVASWIGVVIITFFEASL